MRKHAESTLGKPSGGGGPASNRAGDKQARLLANVVPPRKGALEKTRKMYTANNPMVKKKGKVTGTKS